MRKLHLATGLLFFLLFLLTGQYMGRVLELPLQELGWERVQYRASHLYIFFAAAANVVAGCYWAPAATALRRRLQLAGSLALVASQFLLAAAFFMETGANGEQRTLTLVASVLVLLGAAGSLAALGGKAAPPSPGQH